jgi:uncharacterized repeat protein (TIGR02543 family)
MKVNLVLRSVAAVVTSAMVVSGLALVAAPASAVTVTAPLSTYSDYQVAYDANGGAGAPSSHFGSAYAKVTLSTGTGTARPGYSLGGWNTRTDGTGTTYALGASLYVPRAGLPLYARWTPNKYTVTYDANSGAGTEAAQTADYASTLTLAAGNAVQREGYALDGWSTKSDGTGTRYGLGASLAMPLGGANLYAHWTPKKYDITYNANNGTGDEAAQTADFSSSVSLGSGAAMQRAGYSLDAWSTAPDGSGSRYALGDHVTVPVNGLRLFAHWTPKKYDITYNANNGTGDEAAQTADYASTLTLGHGSAMSRLGYTLGGWNTTRDGSGTEFGLGGSTPMPLDGMKLYARWLPNAYDVVYDANDGTGSEAPQSAAYTSTVTLGRGTRMHRDGYSLDGWTASTDGSGSRYSLGGSMTVPLNGLRLFAHWTPNKYNVTYDANDGAGDEATQTADFASAVALARGTGLSRDGYTLEGWTTGRDGSGSHFGLGGGATMPLGGLKLYAHWKANNYAVTYDANDGAGDQAAQNADFGTAVTLAQGDQVAREGYTLEGWTTGRDGSGSHFGLGDSVRMPVNGLHLFAHWNVNRYGVTYDANDGDGTQADQAADYGTTLALRDGSGLARDGWTLDGWTTGRDGSGSHFGLGDSVRMPVNGMRLYAHWKVNNYTVTYDANDGAGDESATTADFGTSFALSQGAGFNRDGYTLDHWNSRPDDQGTTYALGQSLHMTFHGVALYAHWTPNKYTVTYDPNEGDGTQNDQTADFASSLSLRDGNGFAREGYDLDAWTTGRDGSGSRFGLGDTVRMPLRGMKLFAHWTPRTYDVTYDPNEGQGSQVGQRGDYGSYVGLGDGRGLNRKCWTLDSWNTRPDGAGTRYSLAGTLRVPVNGTRLYARWNANTYGVSYDSNGGDGSQAEQSATYDSSFSLGDGNGVQRDGYTLDGWSATPDATAADFTLGDSTRMPCDGMHLWAHWTPKKYGVHYDPNGGSGDEGDQYGDYGHGIDLGHGYGFGRKCWTLDGWTRDRDGHDGYLHLGQNVTMPLGGMTVYAHWTRNAYAVSYDANAGDGTEPAVTATLDDDVTLGTGQAMTREGWTLDGWTDQADGGGSFWTLGQGVHMPCDGLHLYGHWHRNSYTVAYDANGGTGSEPDQVAKYHDQVTLSGGADMSREGWTLTGWNTEEDGTGTAYALGDTVTIPCHGLRLYAQWTINSYSLTFKANGGVGDDVVTTNEFASSAALASAGTFTRDGYTFVGWTEDSSATTATYAADGTLTMPANDVVLYAVWTAKSYSISYDANNGTGIEPPTPGDYTDTVGLSLGANFTRTGFTFAGWNTAADGTGTPYAAGADFVMPIDGATLYAQWTINGYQVVYNRTGATKGTAPATQPFTVISPATLAGAGSLSRTGMRFTGWNTAADGSGTAYVPGATYGDAADLALYPMWSPVVPPKAVTTKFGTPVTLVPLSTVTPPTGQTWNSSTMRLVTPRTGTLRTKVVTPQGTWTLNLTTGGVTFAPAWSFHGTTTIMVRVQSSAGTEFSFPVTVTVKAPKTATKSATVYFGVLSATLTPQAKRTLDKLVASVLKAGKPFYGTVTGYVQPTHRTANDVSLSMARAKAVAAYLRAHGLTHTVAAKGVGRAPQTGATARRAVATLTYTVG